MQRVGEPFGEVVQTDTISKRTGAAIYMAHCYVCHSNGDGGLAPALNNKLAPRAIIAFQIRHGLGAMPSFDEHVITKDELDDLTKYVVALRKSAQ